MTTEELPADLAESPEERDARWLRDVYQGDHQKQLTWRAVWTGGLLGMFLSISNLYTTLKLGWAFGVAITACVMSFVLWNTARALSRGRLSQMTLLENNCMQSTASAAGYSTGGTVGSAFAALYLVQGQHQPVWVVASMVFLTAALGVFLAIPMKRQMINHEQLAFPSGIAAAETLRSLYSSGAEALRKAHSLIAGIAVGGVIGVLKGLQLLATTFADSWVGRAAAATRKVLPLPEMVNFTGRTLPGGARIGGLGFEPGVLMIGAGMIIGLRVALSMLLGSAVLYFVLMPCVTSMDAAHAGVEGYRYSMWKPGIEEVNPRRWGVWGGTALMVFSSLASFGLQWRTLVRALRLRGGGNGSPAAAVEVPARWLWIGLIPISVGLVVVMKMAFGVGVVPGLVAVLMSFVLALVACRATGEADTTPIGAMGKVTQLVYAVLARGDTTINLMSAGTTAAAAGSAADLLTDLKSGYLLGANPRRQFLAQFFGIFFGTVAIVPAWYALAPNLETLTKQFPMPAASSWKAMADLLAGGIDKLPASAMWAVVVGSLLGTALPLMETLGLRWRRYLPSAMGLGLGMVVDFSNSLGFTIGAVLAWVWMKRWPGPADTFRIPLASGFVAGESLFAAVVTILCAAAGLLAVAG